jgi:phosphoribosyl 1,2-cyclic phosphodiesterase
VDAGLSARQIKLRMNEIGQDPRDLDFILVTHEHSDHIKGIARLVKLYGTKVMMNNKTYLASRGHLPEELKLLDFTTGKKFRFMDLLITPIPISHDAADPVSFIIRTGGIKAAVMTDLGFVSNELFRELKDLDIFILESNHDLDMLMGGSYPLFLKRRISSLTGHLSNTAAAEAIIKISPKERSHIFLAHISETNNHPDIAYSSVRELLEEKKALGSNLHLTYQNRPTALFQVPL